MLIVRKTRHKHSYKNRRFGLTSIEKMTIKSVSEHLDTLINICILTGMSKLDKIQLVQMFGRDHTFIGRVFNWMNKYIREKHGHLVTDNLEYWRHSLKLSV